VAELRWRQDMDDLKEVVGRYPRALIRPCWTAVRDPVEASLIVAAWRTWIFATGMVFLPPPTLGRCPHPEQLDSRDVSCCHRKPGTPRPWRSRRSTEATERHRGRNRLARCWPVARRRAAVESGCVDGPGLTAFTRMWRSFRSSSTSGERADGGLVALYTLLAANPLLPTIDALRMMDARRASAEGLCT